MVLNISLSICDHTKILYILLFNGLVAREDLVEAKDLFETAVHLEIGRKISLTGFASMNL